MINFKCSICKSEVTNISVCRSDVVRDNFIQYEKNTPPSREDREYLSGKILEIIYKCKCGRINERLVRDVPHLDDFCSDCNIICGDNLTQEKYGTLLVIKE